MSAKVEDARLVNNDEGLWDDTNIVRGSSIATYTAGVERAIEQLVKQVQEAEFRVVCAQRQSQEADALAQGVLEQQAEMQRQMMARGSAEREQRRSQAEEIASLRSALQEAEVRAVAQRAEATKNLHTQGVQIEQLTRQLQEAELIERNRQQEEHIRLQTEMVRREVAEHELEALREQLMKAQMALAEQKTIEADIRNAEFNRRVEIILREGRQQDQERNYLVALGYYNACLLLQPDRLDVLQARADTLHHLERYAEAERQYTDCIERQSRENQGPLLFNRAHSRYGLENYAGAYEDFKVANTISRNPAYDGAMENARKLSGIVA